MFDYMHGLQTKFFKEPIFPDLEEEISQFHQDLSHHMDKETRKKLLRLIDTIEELQSRISLRLAVARATFSVLLHTTRIGVIQTRTPLLPSWALVKQRYGSTPYIIYNYCLC